MKVASELTEFVEQEVIPGCGIEPDAFWAGLRALVERFAVTNSDLLRRRQELQQQIDEWCLTRPGAHEAADFLASIGYLVAEPEPFEISTVGLADEIACRAAPQLVVPATNARYALNAANARWGSLYDALYGTDAIEAVPSPGPYDPVRGAKVVAWCRAFLDRAIPLHDGWHADVVGYFVEDSQARAQLGSGRVVGFRQPGVLVGYRGAAESPERLLFEHHGLAIDVRIDRASPIGAADPAGIADVALEAALTVVVDLEDSVATVDAADKVSAYRNWLGLIRGDLSAEVSTVDRIYVRTLAPDREYTSADGTTSVVRPGRAVLLARNVGLLMTTNALLDDSGREVPEGLLDLYITVACALHDPRRTQLAGETDAVPVYVVKPKLHGPEEAAFTDATCSAVEAALGLPANTIKIGLMDEERRTSVNLAASIEPLRHRIFFVNTGFLDRTGDEIHTSFEAGPMVRKAEMKSSRWIAAYERSNVDVALRCGFAGRAQIGKGMWAAPDQMKAMLAEKRAHPAAGATCAWVPSPTAATLHATHYHEVDVAAIQRDLLSPAGTSRPETLAELLTPPISPSGWSHDDVLAELHDNLQSILGYVVRWVNLGVGCSKIPNLAGVGLMEDRATCRVSSQHVANWLHHGVVSLEDVEDGLRAMARLIDRQNESDEVGAMAPAFDGPAFLAARALVLDGRQQPSGYTEPILHAARLAYRQEVSA